MKNIISQPKLLTLLGLSRASIAKWKKEGCPYKKNKNSFDFEANKLREWLKLKGKLSYIQKLDSYFNVPVYDENKSINKPTVIKKKISTEIIDINLENFNIFEARKLIGSMLSHSAADYRNAPPEMKGFHTKNIKDLTEQLRKLEESCIEIDEKLKKVMLVADAQKIMGRACNSIKNKFLNLPGAVCEQLAGMENAVVIEDFLKKKTVGILRELSESIKNGAV